MELRLCQTDEIPPVPEHEWWADTCPACVILRARSMAAHPSTYVRHSSLYLIKDTA